jgi:vesicular inhibitory amino acid transporter
MASRAPNQPTWDQYERGGFSRTGSVSSFGGNRSVQFENESLLGRSVDSHQGHDDEWPPQQLRRRR